MTETGYEHDQVVATVMKTEDEQMYQGTFANVEAHEKRVENPQSVETRISDFCEGVEFTEA